MTKLGNLIFTLKFMIQSYRHNFCHVAPTILLKNIFTNLLKISRLTRSFTTNFSEDDFNLFDFATAVYSFYAFMSYNDNISTLKMSFFLANFTNKEKMNCHCWPPVSPFRSQAGQLLILEEIYLHLILQ